MCRPPHGRATAGPMRRHCGGASFAARGQRYGRRTGGPWGGAASGDSPLLPGAPTPLTRGGSREHSGQLPHRFLLRPRIRIQLANGGLKARRGRGSPALALAGRAGRTSAAGKGEQAAATRGRNHADFDAK
jgi:hypothetical protein